MSTGLVEVIKQAAMNANDNAQLCDLRYGTVVSTNPLKVQVTNLFTIPQSLLVVPEHLTDHSVNVTINWTTSTSGNHVHTYSSNTTSVGGGSGEDAFASHDHTVSGSTEIDGEHHHLLAGKKTMTIHSALKVGDKVALLRKSGGQSYFILDRI